MLTLIGAVWLEALPLLSGVVTTAGSLADTCTQLLGTCLTCACESGRCPGLPSTAAGAAAAAAAATGLGLGADGDTGGTDDTTDDPPPDDALPDDALPPGNEDIEC